MRLWYAKALSMRLRTATTGCQALFSSTVSEAVGNCEPRRLPARHHRRQHALATVAPQLTHRRRLREVWSRRAVPGGANRMFEESIKRGNPNRTLQGRMTTKWI
jgi:hypothetical protein